MSTPGADESLDAEGIPEIEERPPGIDIETDQEGMIPPRDHPIAAGDDAAYAVTAAEERTPESVVDRAARELPDFGADELGVGGSVQGADYRSVPGEADTEDLDEEPLPGEEELSELDPLELTEPDEDEAARGSGIQLLSPDDDDESGTGEQGEEIALDAGQDGEVAESAEEAAMHIEIEP